MSPCYNKACIAIHFTLKQDIAGVNQLLPKIEAQLKPFQVKPHWGKLFTIPSPELQALYPKLEDFKLVMKQYDPTGKFRNQFIDQNLFNA